ncbi:ER membrane protein complex subunit 10 [Hyalella azteca]|uniref:ER membrane protein complex subunit 10 n=1 Tax=Hyalella azteca TaxID=294128 RepID=A0A8B7NJX5_HYAAZ|nr:ER membrane protein complex subunit 10 [Hyalella azteca]
MKLITLLLVVLFQHCSCQNFQDGLALDGQLIVVIEDNLSSTSEEGNTWEERSLVTVRSAKLGQVSISHTRPWNEKLSKSLQKLSKSGDFYKLRLHQQGSKEPNFVYTFADACQLYASGMREHINLMIDTTPSAGLLSQSLVGASLYSPEGRLCHSDVSRSIKGYNSTVSVRTPVPGTVPDTATYIQRIEMANKEKAENKDNRSFFAKYWIYIIPAVLLLMVSGGGQEGGR